MVKDGMKKNRGGFWFWFVFGWLFHFRLADRLQLIQL